MTQKRSLTDAQRKILLYANGKRSMEAIGQMIPTVAEHPDIIIQMKETGLIELIDPELGEVIDPGGAGQAPPETPSQGQTATPAAGAEQSRSAEQELNQVKSELRPEIDRLLGDEGKPALNRLEQVSTRDDLSQLLNKLTELVKLYKGAPAGERFASQFRQWF